MNTRSVLALATVSLALAVGAAAQQQQIPVPRTTIRTQVELVNVVFTATDRDGKMVSGLKPDDFQVFEDKKRQTIDYFNDWTHGSDVPLTIALLIDTSASVKSKLDYEKQTASEFFRNILRKDRDIALVIQFDSDVNLVQDFTQDPARLQAALDTLRAGNSTALYDAIYLAVNDKLKDETGRKVIVVITDGTDTSSKIKEKEAIEVAQRADVLIYGIGVRDEYGESFGVLKRFAEDTGGSFFHPAPGCRNSGMRFAQSARICRGSTVSPTDLPTRKGMDPSEA